MPRLKIAIDGAQSTGKTTLLKELASYFGSRFAYIPEASRIVAGRFGVHASSDWNELFSKKELLNEFFFEELRWQREQESQAESFIVDSSLLLVAAYRLLFGIHEAQEEFVTEPYDLILYCPVLDPGIEDGFRFLSKRQDLDSIYRQLISEYHPSSFLELPPGEARLQAATAAVENAMRGRRDV
jgi:nicotinamide riboside kinase